MLFCSCVYGDPFDSHLGRKAMKVEFTTHTQTKLIVNITFCLQSLLPRGKQPNPLREKHFQVNHTLKEAIETIPNSIYLVSDPGFVRSDGTISHEDMGDYLHLTRKGYKKLCQHIHHVIVKFLKYWAELLKEARGMNEVQISPFFLKKRVARRALLVSIRGTGIKTVIPVVAK